jgi:UTP:GlnB (protein PII) uridylyltransferase
VPSHARKSAAKKMSGRYTKPGLRKRLLERIKAGSKGGNPGQWSARKAQMLAAAYKKAGGGYRGGKSSSQKSLKKWTGQNWRTASGKRSRDSGEVYAPAKKISKLKSTPEGRKKLAAATKKKRAATKAGKQFARHGLHKGAKRSRA